VSPGVLSRPKKDVNWRCISHAAPATRGSCCIDGLTWQQPCLQPQPVRSKPACFVFSRELAERFQGLALVNHKVGSFTAEVAEIEIQKGRLRVRRIVRSGLRTWRESRLCEAAAEERDRLLPDCRIESSSANTGIHWKRIACSGELSVPLSLYTWVL
jgi:hypothetical protein